MPANPKDFVGQGSGEFLTKRAARLFGTTN